MAILKPRVYCQICGNRIIRYPDNRYGERWRCRPECESTVSLRDGDLLRAVTDALNAVIQAPDMLRASSSHRPASLSVTKLQNELNREMDKANADADSIQDLIFALAAEKYNTCDDDSQITLMLRDAFETHGPINQFDSALFKNTVDRALISNDGTASLLLKNGQTLPTPQKQERSHTDVNVNAMPTQAERIITVMPADPALLRERTRRAKNQRVAAYCRVSTDKEDQQNSYEAQIASYTDKIVNHAGWSMAGIFADEGISGTSAKKRPDFLRLMELCKKGKVDMILCKSISRFARNTVDCLSYIRMLKELGVAVVFEKESINTMEATSELMLSFMSAFAQEESESISANVTWGKRRAYQEGKVTFQYSRFYGYEKGKDGQPKIIPDQAAVVRRIFRTYLAGYSLRQIKDELESAGIPSSTDKPEWSVYTLQYMIRNEKYIGDAILQKTYMVDCISKKAKKNNGEIPKYYITDNHAAIIERDIWNRVQEEIARRAGKRKTSQKQTRTEHGKYSGKYALSELIVCGDCGAHYRRVTWARNGVKRVVWRCISRLEQGTKYCKQSPTIEENRLHSAIVDAFNRLAEDKDEVLAALRESLRYALDGGQDDGPDMQAQIRERQESTMKLVSDSMESGMEQNDSEFKRLSDEIRVLQDKLAVQKKTASNIQNDRSGMDAMISLLEGMEHHLPEYDDVLTRQMVERVTVKDNGAVTVRFKVGAEYEIALG